MLRLFLIPLHSANNSLTTYNTLVRRTKPMHKNCIISILFCTKMTSLKKTEKFIQNYLNFLSQLENNNKED